MKYIQGLADQTEIFLFSLGFGFLLGVLYCIFRMVRMTMPDSKGFVFFADLLYFAVCTFLIFCFIMVTDGGRIRAYVAVGIILGWTVCYFSFGMIAVRLGKSVSEHLRRLFSVVFKPFVCICRAISRKIGKSPYFCKKNTEKTYKKEKIILQKYKGIVYNLLGYNKK